MNILACLNDLVGKQGLIHVHCNGKCFEPKFTFVSVKPAAALPKETDAYGLEEAISRSRFLVYFENAILIDGHSTRMISGRDISRIITAPQPGRV